MRRLVMFVGPSRVGTTDATDPSTITEPVERQAETTVAAAISEGTAAPGTLTPPGASAGEEVVTQDA
jgi:hypothetical protein